MDGLRRGLPVEKHSVMADGHDQDRQSAAVLPGCIATRDRRQI